MKKTSKSTKIIALFLSAVAIFTLFNNTITTVSAEMPISILSAQPDSDDNRTMEVTFNKPVSLFEDFLSKIYLTDSLSQSEAEWRISIDAEGIKAVGTAEGEASDRYSFYFWEEITKSGIFVIEGIGETEYVLENKMVDVTFPKPDEVLLNFRYDTKFISNDSWKYISAYDSDDAEASKINALSFEERTSKTFAVTFEKALPPNGVIAISEPNIDDDDTMSGIAGMTDGKGFLKADVQGNDGHDAATIRFRNPWLCNPTAELVNENTVQLKFNESVRINSPEPELLFAVTQTDNAADMDGWLVHAKTAVVSDSSNIILTFDVPIVQNGFVRIFGNVLSDAHDQVLAPYIDTTEGKHLFTDKFTRIGGTNYANGSEIGMIFAAYTGASGVGDMPQREDANQKQAIIPCEAQFPVLPDFLTKDSLDNSFNTVKNIMSNPDMDSITSFEQDGSLTENIFDTSENSSMAPDSSLFENAEQYQRTLLFDGEQKMLNSAILDTGDNMSLSSGITFSQSDIPSGLSVRYMQDGVIHLYWDEAVGAKSYNFYINGYLISNTPKTYIAIPGMTEGFEFSFAVSSVDADEIESDLSADFTCTFRPTRLLSGYYEEDTLDYLKYFDGYDIEAYRPDGTALADSDRIGTGTRINIIRSQDEIYEFTAVLFGDLDGDGYIDSSDLTVMKNHLTGKTPLPSGSAFITAGDLYSEGKITLNSRVGLEKYLSTSTTSMISQRKLSPLSTVGITMNTTAPTNQDITFTIDYPDDALLCLYGPTSQGPWYLYDGELTVSQNVYFYVAYYNLAGWSVSPSIRTITNIDKTVPTVSLQRSDKTFTFTAADYESGLLAKKWAAGKRDADYFLENGTVVTVNTIVVSDYGWYTFAALDAAGNVTIRQVLASYGIFNPTGLIEVDTEDSDEDTSYLLFTPTDNGNGIANWGFRIQFPESNGWSAWSNWYYRGSAAPGYISVPSNTYFKIEISVLDNALNIGYLTEILIIVGGDVAPSGDFVVPSDVKATILPNAILNMPQGSNIFVYGTLNADGTNGEITIKGLNNSAWEALYVDENGYFFGENLNISGMTYGGNSGYGLILMGESYIGSSDIAGIGLYIDTSHTVRLENNNITVNTGGDGIYTLSETGGHVMFINNSIYDSSGTSRQCAVALLNSGTGTVFFDDNIVSSSADCGILVGGNGSGNVSLWDNSIYGASDCGLFISGTGTGEIYVNGNYISNADIGAEVNYSGSGAVRIISNSAVYASDYGISVDKCLSNTLEMRNNTVSCSGSGRPIAINLSQFSANLTQVYSNYLSGSTYSHLYLYGNLQKNLTYNENLYFDGNGISLNGKTLTVNGALTINSGGIGTGGGSLVVTGSMDVHYDGFINVNGGAVSISGTADLSGGEISSSGTVTIGGYVWVYDGAILVSGGTFNLNSSLSLDYSYVEVSGGTLNVSSSVNQYAGLMYASGGIIDIRGDYNPWQNAQIGYSAPTQIQKFRVRGVLRVGSNLSFGLNSGTLPYNPNGYVYSSMTVRNGPGTSGFWSSSPDQTVSNTLLKMLWYEYNQNDFWAYCEYFTYGSNGAPNGTKRGYVRLYDTSWSGDYVEYNPYPTWTVNARQGTSNIYDKPGGSSIGSVSSSSTVYTVLWQDQGYYFVEFTSSGQKKRGYLKVGDLFQTSTDGINNGTWYVIRNVETGRCIDIYNGSNTNGVALITYTPHYGNNQQWLPEAYGGKISLRSKIDNTNFKYLGVNSPQNTVAILSNQTAIDLYKVTSINCYALGFIGKYLTGGTDGDYVTLTNESGGGLTSEQLWLFEPAGAYFDPAGITVNNVPNSLTIGQTCQLSASVSPSNADQRVTWTSNHNGIATVSSSGKVTAIGGGTARITVKSVVNNSLSVSFDIHISSNKSFNTAYIGSLKSQFANLLGMGKKTPIHTYTTYQCIDIILSYDSHITSIANQLRMPKAYIQTIMMRELWCLNSADTAADTVVMNYFYYKDDLDYWSNAGWLYQSLYPMPLPPTPLHTDSSTGLCQIFAWVAIDAYNKAIDKGIVSGTKYNINNWRDCKTMWYSLKDNNQFNITMASLNLVECASDKKLGTDYYLFTENQIKTLFTRYNSTASGITQYGNECYEYYLLFKHFNQY